jgi:metal-responsive CopG/Arc/MetJ family transcriptional regulator
LKEKDEARKKALKRREHRREIKEKEERIMAVIKDHQNDVKEFNTDTKSL